jgi:hypothetical protein
MEHVVSVLREADRTLSRLSAELIATNGDVATDPV